MAERTFFKIHLKTEGGRFELPKPCGLHAFQACALGHYATLPFLNGLMDSSPKANQPILYNMVADNP